MIALLQYLEKKKDDRGVMADLRCALVESKRFKAYPHLGYFGGIDSKDSIIIQTIAGLYASHPMMSTTGTIGDLCRKLCRNDEDLEKGTMAKRLQYILSANRDEICDRVVRIVLRAKAEGFPVNYNQLYDDLKYWNDRVKNKWAAAFWTPGTEVDDALPD
jgi:CRISPR system Cascade subunit CasB